MPKHYNQIIFPAEVPKTEDDNAKNKNKENVQDDCDENEDGSDDDCVSVYTDPALNCGSTYQAPMASASIVTPEQLCQPRVQTSKEDSSTQVVCANRNSSSANNTAKTLLASTNPERHSVLVSSCFDAEDEADLFEDVFDMLVQKESAEEDTARSSSVSEVEQCSAQFLFKIILDQDCSIEMYDDDTPEQMCARICRARCIKNEQIKADFLKKIDMKYKKAMQARRSATAP